MNRIVVLIHIVWVLISCNPKQQSEHKIFRYNAANGITSLDPAFARNLDNIWAVGLLYNGLVQTDSALQIQGSIARSWDFSDSGRKLTFYLRNDVYFHDNPCFKDGKGRQVVAKDFVHSLKRIIDPETASPGAWIFTDRLADLPFEAPNDTTLVVRLSKAFAPILSLLSMPYCFVVPYEATSLYGKDFGTHPVGTGPFRFAGWEDGVKLNFLKNTGYFDKAPNPDAVSISFLSSRHTEFLLFKQRKLEMFNGLESSFKDEILNSNGQLQLKYQHVFKLIKHPFLNTEFLSFNLDPKSETDPVFRDIHFRKAVAHSIDRKMLVTFMRNSIGIPADNGFIPPGLPGFNAARVYQEFNIEKARRELKLSTYRKGQNLTLHTTKEYLDICLFVQKQLSNTGISIRVEVLPASILKTEKANGKLGFFRGSWIADYPDPENYMSCFTSANRAPAGPNYSQFSSDSYDLLYQQALLTDNTVDRMKKIEEMNQLIMDSVAIIPLFYDESLRLYHKHIHNTYSDALNSLRINQIKY